MTEPELIDVIVSALGGSRRTFEQRARVILATLRSHGLIVCHAEPKGWIARKNGGPWHFLEFSTEPESEPEHWDERRPVYAPATEGTAECSLLHGGERANDPLA